MNIIEIVFIFTAAMLLFALVRLIPLMWDQKICLPHIIPFTVLTPTHYLIMYPSAIFQVWFWADRLGVFVNG